MNQTQLVVKSDSRAIELLENIGFANPQRLPNGYVFPVFIVDIQSKTIFGTNTACMAAACSSENRPIVLNFEVLKIKLSNRQ